MNKRLWIAMAIVLLVAMVAACTAAPTPAPTQAPPTAAPQSSNSSSAPASSSTTGKTFQIGITVIVEHPVLTAMQKGFQDRMKELGYVEGKNVVYEVKNAQGDLTNATTIAKQFVASKKDMIVGLGTPSIVAAAKETKDIPIVFAGMTDPVGSGVVKTMDQPGGNVTGTTDWVPPEDQLAVLKEAYPNAKNIGIIFNPSEANSKSWLDTATPAAQKVGLTFVTVPVAATGDLQAAAQSLVGRVDLILAGPDNTVSGGMEIIAKVAISNKLPVLSIAQENAAQGALMGMGVDYYKLGQMAADQADKIFKGESPSTIAVQKLPQLVITVNTKTAAAIGAKLPDSIMNRATKTE
ncbi:MAG: ABC transporter substrate-binding protein [Chloroflexi bacterium]|nr:ABC transporter substrate-binding protein [Chloroflexota bacterium]